MSEPVRGPPPPPFAPKQIAESCEATEVAHENVERFGEINVMVSASATTQAASPNRS
jgi:hypothetical protein